MTDIDGTIQKIENLYQSLTGSEAPPSETPYARIPPEKDPTQYVEGQLDQLLRALEGPLPRVAAVAAWTPPVSIWENGKEILLCLDLPGISREAVEIVVSQNLLSVSGSRRPTVNGDGNGNGTSQHQVRFTERLMGPFRRTIALPPDSSCDQMSAEMKEGVLEIRVPRTGKSTAQTVTVK
jgi:HSP20 family protein